MINFTNLSDEEILNSIPEKKCHIINKHYEAVKRLFDIFFVLVFSPFILPIMLFIALWIKLDSKGPVLYKQKRAGMDGKPFYMYKLRTMTVGAEKFGLELGNDAPQVTRVGRIIRPFSLDELMQFINIFKGEMSFIGPRPQPIEYVEQWKKEGILKVKPGIIAMTMLKYREEFLPEKIFMFEKKYIENFSIEQDLFLFFTVLYKYRKLLYWIILGFITVILIIFEIWVIFK